jgi:hypothetical protein
VSRAPNPQRIFAARRAATIERLVSFGILRDYVIPWIGAYEAENDPLEGRYAGDCWDKAYETVHAAYVAGEKPPARDDA